MKTKKALLNLLTDVIPLLVISVLGIFKLKYFLQILGSDTLGLYQLFSEVMIYVAIVDGGLSSAILYSLYKPNVENDVKAMNRLLSAAYKVFSLIGIAVFSIALIVSFFVPFLIKDAGSFSYAYIILTFMLFSLSNVIGYFFVPYNALLEVKEKKYLTNTILQIGQIILSITEIIFLLSGFSFISILVMHAIIKLISNLMLMIVAKKLCPKANLKIKDKDYSFVKEVKHLIVHKVNGLVSSNIDIILISKIMGLSSVAIYSAYKYIINMLKKIIDRVNTSLIAIIGNSLVESKSRAKEIFNEFKSLMFFTGTIVSVPLLFAINSFINIWYEGAIETSFAIALAFSIYMFVFSIKLPITAFIVAGGYFKDTKKCAIVDTCINLTLSLSLIWIWGISGVVFATAFSVFVAEYILKGIVLHKKLFEEKSMKFYLGNIKFFVILLIDGIVGYYVIKSLTIASIGTWFLVFSIYFILNAFVVFGIYKLLKETTFTKRIIKLLKSKGKS